MENHYAHNPVAIGQRIQARRGELNLTQLAVVDILRNRGDKSGGMSINTYRNIEHGKLGDLSIRQVLELCEVLSCDIGYLLYEYDSKTLTTEEIIEHTGLTEKAVETLHKLHAIQQDEEADEKKKTAIRHVLPFVNQLLEDRVAVQRIGANLNEISFATEYESSFGGTGVPDRIAFRSRNGGMYDLARTIEQQADNLLGNPYSSMKTDKRA